MSTASSKRFPHGEILVVEGNAASLKLLWEILTSAGYRVRPASDGELANDTEGLVDELRNICAGLRPPILDVIGLPEAIEWQVEELEKGSELEFDLELDLGGLILEKHTATVAFRLIQESLGNVIRHGAATRVRISLLREGCLYGGLSADPGSHRKFHEARRGSESEGGP